MKNSILNTAIVIIGIFVLLITFTNCGNKTSENKEHLESTEHKHEPNDSTNHDASMSMTHACSMHPEVTGKEGDKCSKCGMALELVKDSHNN